MSRCLLLTGTSTGSHTVPLECASHGDIHVSFTKFRKSSMVAYRRPLIQISDERRTVGRREHHVVAADLDAPAVAAVHRELTRGAQAQLPGQAGLEAHTHPDNLSPGGSEQFQRLIVATELDADFRQDPVGVRLEPIQRLVVEQLVWRDAPARRVQSR